MARRDNVKARKRLKKSKKIYTNTPTDIGLSLPTLRVKRPSISRKHTSQHKPYYVDHTGKIRVFRGYPTTIRITAQYGRSKDFNKYGLQGDMTPQKLQSIARSMDLYLHGLKVSPKTRNDIMNAWKKYYGAAYGYFYSKEGSINKEKNKNIIKYFEQNTNLLGLRQSSIDPELKVKQAYLINNIPRDKFENNLSEYELWYNDARIKQLEINRQKEENQLRPNLGEFYEAPEAEEQPDDLYNYNDTQEEEFLFYNETPGTWTDKQNWNRVKET